MKKKGLAFVLVSSLKAQIIKEKKLSTNIQNTGFLSGLVFQKLDKNIIKRGHYLSHFFFLSLNTYFRFVP